MGKPPVTTLLMFMFMFFFLESAASCGGVCLATVRSLPGRCSVAWSVVRVEAAPWAVDRAPSDFVFLVHFVFL